MSNLVRFVRWVCDDGARFMFAVLVIYAATMVAISAVSR